MKIHHLNCGTFCPIGGSLVCHCLLVETESGLVLIDTGLGTQDLQHPQDRLGRMFLTFARPTLQMPETAIEQIKTLGFKKEDVRHIVVTHLDVDHGGGISDFPHATVHLYEKEIRAARLRKKWIERSRYHPEQWSKHDHWAVYEMGGEKWFGFESVRGLKGLPPEILLIPLMGHTAGHSGVAVQTAEGWLLHAGDAYFHHGEIEEPKAYCPSTLKIFQKIMAVDEAKRIENQKRLRRLAHEEKEVRIFCAHDVKEFKSF